MACQVFLGKKKPGKNCCYIRNYNFASLLNMWREQVPHSEAGICACVPWIFLFSTYRCIIFAFPPWNVYFREQKKNFACVRIFFKNLNPKVQFAPPVCARQTQCETFPMTNVISVILIACIVASKFFPVISCLGFFYFFY